MFFGIGTLVLLTPVSSRAVKDFEARHQVNLTPAGHERLTAHLNARRRTRTIGVLAAGAASLAVTATSHGIQLNLIMLMAGWFAGAVAAEFRQRHRTRPKDVQGSSASRLPLPVALIGVALAYAVSAVMLRSEGTNVAVILRWAVAALAACAVSLAATAFVTGRGLRDLDHPDSELGPATSASAVRGLTAGGALLTVLCLAKLWENAVPGPYDQTRFPQLATLAILLLAFVVLSSNNLKRPAVRVGLAAMLIVVPLAWAIPVRLAQSPPFQADQVHAVATLRLVTLDRLAEAASDLGLTGRLQPQPTTASMSELVGRLDIDRPAHDGDYYMLLGIDRRTGRPVEYLYGPDGAEWYGGWSTVLSRRYPWLSSVAPIQTGGGYMDTVMGVWLGSAEAKPLWFSTPIADNGTYSVADLQLVIFLVRNDDGYIYWARPVQTIAG
ncbi:hypothetical protein AB0H43_36760 [Hamadaea sp. NPDC050747]|uniref:hypothetical protein n=1 Tax=Hamadaea sp. NPDC050747 TaxID=3155789 RepID=UPI0034098066